MSVTDSHPAEQSPSTPPRRTLRILRFFIGLLVLIGLLSAVAVKINADTMLQIAPEFADRKSVV